MVLRTATGSPLRVVPACGRHTCARNTSCAARNDTASKTTNDLASGLFSFVLDGGDNDARARLIDGLAHFGIGFSWGGYESLALPVDPASIRTATRWHAEGPLVRLHIGLEDPEDLIMDLALGLERFANLS